MLNAARGLLIALPANKEYNQRKSSVLSIISVLEAAIKLHGSMGAGVKKTSGSQMDCTEDDSQLDSFACSRRLAIESTVILDHNTLPLLSDIIGLQDAKDAMLEALVDPILYPEWFAQSNVQPWRCILLFGPPGTGKSALCGAIAREVGARFYSISSSDLISSWSGQSERLIRSLFDAVLAHDKPVIIFMDEVDSLCRSRCNNEDDANRRVKTELLVQLPRLQIANSQSFLISATNCPWELDPAFLRRFEKKIYIRLPDADARAALFSKLLSKTKMDSDISWEWLASQTEFFSGDDIRRLCTEIALQHFRLYKEGKKNSRSGVVSVSRNHICHVIANTPPTVSRDLLEKYDSYLSQRGESR